MRMRQRKSQPAGVLTHSCRWTRVSSTQLYWLSTDTDKSEKTLRRRDAWSIEYTKTCFMWYVHYSSFNLKLFFLYSHLILDVMTGKEGISTHTHTRSHVYKGSNFKVTATFTGKLLTETPRALAHFCFCRHCSFFQLPVECFGVYFCIWGQDCAFSLKLSLSCCSLVLFADGIKAGCHGYTVNTCRRRQITNCIMYTHRC